MQPAASVSVFTDATNFTCNASTAGHKFLKVKKKIFVHHDLLQNLQSSNICLCSHKTS